MELGLQGKHAIVTGGSAGIGLAIAEAFVKEGADVLIVGRNEERLQKAAAQLYELKRDQRQQIAFLDRDLAAAPSAQEIAEKAFSLFGGIDILVNNAGAAKAGSFFELTDQDFADAWNLKLFGHIRLSREVARYMMERQKGKIINIIGTGGRTPAPTFLAGGTTNAAYLNFTKGLSKVLAPYNIHVNAISPGITATERANRLAEQNAAAKGISVEEQKAETAAAIPLGRLVDPDEIAHLTLLLASDLMKSMTGSEIIIDGGQQQSI